MTRSEPAIRQATPADVKHFGTRVAEFSFRGYVIEYEGAPIAIGGIYYQDGTPVAFSDLKPEVRRYKKTMVRACKMLLTLFDNAGAPVYAIANQKEPTAPYLLAKLGFKPTGVFGPAGETMVRN